jgi:hypothetical protein
MILLLVLAALRYKRVVRERAAARAIRARELGWRYDDARDGDIDFRMNGMTRGIRWELVYDSDRSSSDSSPKVIWRWREMPARRIELAIMGGMADRIAFGAAGRALIGLARRLGAGSRNHPDGDDFYQHALKVDSDLTVFQKEWIVRARKPARFRGVASHELAELLTRWPDHSQGRAFQPAGVVNLTYDPDGLSLHCGYGVEEMALLEHLVKIGCAVASRLPPADSL